MNSYWKNHHKAACHIGLKDPIKGALGEGAFVEGEHLRNIAKTLLVIPGPLHSQGALWVVRRGSVF